MTLKQLTTKLKTKIVLYYKKNIYYYLNMLMLFVTFWLFFEGHKHCAWVLVLFMTIVTGWRFYKGWGLYKSTIFYGASVIKAMQYERRKLKEANKKLKKKK